MIRIFLFFLASLCLYGDPIVGIWKTAEPHSGQSGAFIATYLYNGKCYGRIIQTFDENGQTDATLSSPGDIAKGIKGRRPYTGLDILYGFEQKGNRWVNGHVIDPEKGDVYDAELWREGDFLVMKGKLLIFWSTEHWPRATEKDFPQGMPDLGTMTPKIPKVK